MSPLVTEDGREVVWDTWRGGDQVVMGPDAQLRDRCLQTDVPALGRTTDVSLSWLEQAVYRR